MDAVVVTHNSADEIGRLLSQESLREALDRVIVVDNGSSDETPKVARGHGAIVLDRGRNGGFAVGVNEGARATRGAWFAVLNPDIGSITPDVARRLERHLNHPAVGVAAPALVRPDGNLQDSAREVPSPLDLATRRFWKRAPDEVHSDRPVIVEWVVAACIAIRRDAFEAVGGFDERYFLYFEDVDFGVRMRRAGYAVVYDPTIRVLHDHAAGSQGSLTSWATRQHIRSAYAFYSRHSAYLWPRRVRPPGRVAALR
jgi:N-acetylglucosaminyl-diphospho-decaprenol L-rhamnosyltransferase